MLASACANDIIVSYFLWCTMVYSGLGLELEIGLGLGLGLALYGNIKLYTWTPCKNLSSCISNAIHSCYTDSVGTAHLQPCEDVPPSCTIESQCVRFINSTARTIVRDFHHKAAHNIHLIWDPGYHKGCLIKRTWSHIYSTWWWV